MILEQTQKRETRPFQYGHPQEVSPNDNQAVTIPHILQRPQPDKSKQKILSIFIKASN